MHTFPLPWFVTHPLLSDWLEALGVTTFILFWNLLTVGCWLCLIAVGVRLGLWWHARAQQKKEQRP